MARWAEGIEQVHSCICRTGSGALQPPVLDYLRGLVSSVDRTGQHASRLRGARLYRWDCGPGSWKSYVVEQLC